MSRKFSIVMEFENATTQGGVVAPVFAALLRQFDESRKEHGELILVFDPAETDGDGIDRAVDNVAPKLRDCVAIRTLAAPGLRYYEQKNAGARVATGDVLIFLDSDMIPQEGWLRAILAPFENSETVAVSGHTYLGHSDFFSRVLALVWVFPLRDDSEREIRRRSLNANNCAFKRTWFLANPFPCHSGFKVSCSFLARQMERQGIEYLRVRAVAQHQPLEGWRFLYWRACVAGRDEDARFATLRNPGSPARIRRAFVRWAKQLLRSSRRILTRHREVRMPIVEVPAALVLGWAYYTVFFAAQVRSAVSGPRSAPERIPEFVKRF